MKPLTMSEEQEAEDRDALVGNNWWALGSGVHQNIADRAWDEIDALRARADKLEGALVCANNNTKRGRLALAASQAEVRELREALAMTWPGISGYSAPQSPLGALGGDIQRTHRAATAALSRPPGDDTALREMLGRAINEAWWGKAYPEEANESSAVLRSHIVNRILGQPGDDAAPTKEE